MYLKRLELRGFKTFALYTDFLFDAGITAIVGPNGSGKSNIADAIRWVLGEQTFSALRGKRTEDMIFAGTSRRAKLGMAEAVLTFDNSSQWLPIAFNEVTISRRAYRSGENQYFLNGSRVRLREMLELLGTAGLGRGGFIVLGQGLVDAALSLRPEERRTLFEQAAGIHIYQEKRSDALNKLGETQQNLVRLNDILNEIAPRLRDLERQAKRAQERELLQRDLEELLRVWYGYHWRRLQGRLAEADSAERRRMDELNLARARMQELDALLTGTQGRQNELRRQLSVWHRTSSDLHAQAEAKGRELAVNRERHSQLQQRTLELEAELLQAKAREQAVQSELAARNSDWQRLQEEQQTQTDLLEQARSQAERSQTARADLERALETARNEAFRLATAQADASNRLKQVQERRAQLQAEHLTHQRELRGIQEQLSALQADMEQAKAMGAQTQSAIEAHTAQRQEVENALSETQQLLDEHRSSEGECTRTVQRLEDRREMLEGLRHSMASFGPGVRFTLENRNRLPGMAGPVASLLQVPERLERAIEVALGAHAQSLVVETWEDARAVIDLLRISSAGRATCLPLDSLSVPAPGREPSGEGVIGIASRMIECDQRFERVVELLLGSVIVVEDLTTAQRLRPQLEIGQRVVTLAGDLVCSSGALAGGSEAKGLELLAQEREWREIPTHLAAAQESQCLARHALEQSENRCTALQGQLTEISDRLSSLSSQRDAHEQTLLSLGHRVERLQQESGWRLRLAQQQTRELAALDEKAALLQSEAEDGARCHDAHKAQLEQWLAQMEAARSEDEAVRQAMAQAEATVAAARRQAKTHEQLVSSHEASLEQLRAEVAARSQRLDESRQQTALLAAAVSQLQSENSALSAEILAISAQLEPAEAEVASLEEQVLALEKELTLSRQRLNELELLHNQQVLERERQQDALQAMEQRIEEDLGDIEYPSERAQQLRMEFLGGVHQVLATTDVLPETMSSEIKDMKARLRRLGSVNPGAPQEYQEVLQRHEFLQSQVSDLQQSSISLQKVIAELDQVMETEFLAIFKASAAQFAHYFEHLFGGGQAKLALTDPDNPSTTGVEIVARPPGKRQQSLALLSGGERALTAAALLFALLKVKPMPFCFMDEVDAMLDEANVGRFRDLLEEFSARTQFIVISHNRATIEAANTIYGVSMSEEGVSKVVSLRLDARAVAPS